MTEDFMFTRTGSTTFAPTRNTEGAWSAEDFHFASLAGLIVHETLRVRGDDSRHISRVSYDILGRLPYGEVEISVKTIRPGRQIELVQTTVRLGDRDAIVARIWFLEPAETEAAAACEIPFLPNPDDCPERVLSEIWEGGHLKQVHARHALVPRPGRAATWLTSPNQIVDGEERNAVAEFFSRIDIANGIAARQEPNEWAYPNVDLTVHLFRQPKGTWTGLDTTVTWGSEGVGLTSSVLHDVEGPVGRAEQSITLRRVN
ncbi:thioesterase family protein [Corynebacterium breve]|uniref:Thioesterase family protein n=1 Tax=Corynebacterium breve TaxID=3049799 RepID=A0ABY8VFX6_9CORY|nr:thioesterase family protein [Corynebacterium breve]WIM68398.1 thioesterase family protein [Corynebacterium breve]